MEEWVCPLLLELGIEVGGVDFVVCDKWQCDSLPPFVCEHMDVKSHFFSQSIIDGVKLVIHIYC